ncbi:hypothetical protein COCCADRAFT_89680 [Bipolaris zeicola 26-R-13]|uniref:Uncharacterized protein n=1 Tax=Cochliobolus carbonum (strain 26-R-13) TaxID=930089 RepID=W6Y855_COCC2|nr:uncharacterized protein COCCADRAFT_89680 [Bipolaris zeicola 26-R-13]EUC35807.1 hypothetical protein COCCADRAFT_89680 [Bipolaris zeicola 26-R-13]
MGARVLFFLLFFSQKLYITQLDSFFLILLLLFYVEKKTQLDTLCIFQKSLPIFDMFRLLC